MNEYQAVATVRDALRLAWAGGALECAAERFFSIWEGHKKYLSAEQVRLLAGEKPMDISSVAEFERALRG